MVGDVVDDAGDMVELGLSEILKEMKDQAVSKAL